MTWAAALFLAVAFLALLGLSRAPARASEAFARTRQAVATVRDRTLDDGDKERTLRIHAGRLLVLCVTLTASAIAAAAIPLGVVALLGALSIVEFDAVVAKTLSWDFLVVVSALALATILVRRRRRS